MGSLAPQPCSEGYFCPTNSSTPTGGGKCYPGHYCPENSPYPIQTPPGAFAGDDGGAIVGSLCLPGTFSPRPGQISCSPCPAGSSCLSYGTYVPRVCGRGTYRSKADSVQCKPCPERTYSFASGLTDISQCLPCAEGRVCGSQGMTDLKQSDACSEGSVCGYMTDRATQFTTQCPGGSYCGNQTTTLNQYLNNLCPSGGYCERGTTSKLKTRDKCGKSHYCTSGTSNPEPSITRCPRQTGTSLAGAKDMDFCSPNLVAICDKIHSSKSNPFDGLSYYPLEDATSNEQAELVEMLVVKKILPFNEDTSDIMPWKNDTLEVVRTCPAYGVLPDESSTESNQESLTVIGRNFRNSTTLTCQYRICLGSSWITGGGVGLVTPGHCRDEMSNMSEPIIKMGTYVSKTRVLCPMPGFDTEDDFQPLNISIPLNSSSTQLCLRDVKGQMFLSQECSNSDLASGHCAFEDALLSFGLRKRVYSLILPCSEDEVLKGWCANVPTASSKLNPCLTQRMIVDVSNNGKKFSGDNTVVPYTSLESYGGLSSDADDSYQILPTYAFYEFIPVDHLNLLELDSNTTKKKHLRSSFDADGVMCHRVSVHEEGLRLSEDGWFESTYMSRFHLSFDWKHLPSDLRYDKDFRLAIYVVPSRCRESKCNDSGRSHSYQENIPCLQPVELPVWFTDDSIAKNQLMNMTLTSLDDSRFRIEIQIVNGLALPMASFFENTMSVVMEHPQRANTVRTKRSMSPLVSFEEKVIDMPYIFGIRLDEGHSQQVSLPRNLPPRWKKFERGRVLVGMNTTHENEAPTIKDGNESITEGTDFWDNPFQSASVAKEQSDVYFETFHGVSRDGSSGSYQYEHGALILPYLPYFSNCREFDSHVSLWALVESATQCQLPDATVEFPEDWWRRAIPALPHQDDVKAIGPSDFMKFYPVADWCERKLHCNFEEDLPKPDVTPRWFEAESGTALFSIIRDPIDYYQYTGRDSSIIGRNDGGGQRFINSIDTLQEFIPAKVDRSPSLNIEGGCTVGTCFPRMVTLDISYHQVDVNSKRIVQVKVLYDKFDKDSSDDRYELRVKFRALNYQELVIKFAFSRGLFLLLFTQIGVGTVVAAFTYWVVVRLTTNLERPPRLRITGFLWLTFPPAFGGFLLGLIPISIVTALVFYLMKGYLIFTPDTDPEGRRWLFPSSTRLHYSDVSIDPDHLQTTRQGRTGLAFVTMALISLYFTSRVFVPKRPSSGSATDEQANARALSTWQRGNFIISSFVMGLFLVVVVEWSFWGSFGTYIWEAILFLKILSIFVGSIVDKQLGDALLSAPVMTAMGLVQGIVTMSANDFMDFLLSYIVGFGFLILERMYIGPLQGEVFGWAYDVFLSGFCRLQALFPSIFGVSQKKSSSNSSEDALMPEVNNETVEPMLGSYASYSCDTLSLLYTPYIMVVIMVFSDEVEITKLYGIKEADMEYYVLFALAIIPFQLITDILLHNALELMHGWKMHEYLEYCKVRFLQREVWWKGLETSTLDECIDESLRSMDQMCFSSQYYMLNTIHVNAIIYFVLGIEMMTRAKYTAFGDPALFYIVITILMCSMSVKLLLTSIARLFGLWKIKYEKRGWHAKVLDSEGNPNVEQWEDIQVKDHDQYQMEQRITSETFRYKFLNYNRSWILSQLPDMITPRVSANQRPYMINQFARILGQVNGDISSDSDSDDEPEFEAPPMTAPTRTLARTWLLQANRQLRLKKLVQPLIQQSRGNECQICLSRNLLQVETLHNVADVDEQFKNEYRTEEIDQVLFKRFWQRNQRYQTICLPCIQKRKSKEHEKIITDDRSLDESDSSNNLTSDDMDHTAKSILSNWYVAARNRLESVEGN